MSCSKATICKHPMPATSQAATSIVCQKPPTPSTCAELPSFVGNIRFAFALICFIIYLSNLPGCMGAITNKGSPTKSDRPYTSILYTAVDGGKVALPCNIIPPSIDDHVVLILWYKDDEFEPIYTIDARKDSLEHARIISSTNLADRVYFNQHNMPAFLQIDPVQIRDAGEYRCRVDFKKARTVNIVIQLKVIVPPEEPIISYKYPQSSQQHLKGLIGPFNEGDKLILLCTTFGGKPRPTLTWWKDYSIIDDSFEYNSKDVATNELSINSLARHHLLSIFTCQAINNNITIASSASITIDLNLKPLQVKIRQIAPSLLSEHEAKFECSTFGSKPKAKLYWLFNGLRYDTTFQGDMQTISIISLPLKREHNSQILSCHAENPKIPNSDITENFVLNIEYIPELTLQLGSSTISLHSIQEGNDIYFDCVVDANPLPTGSIIWKFNEEVLEPRQGIIQSNFSLVLQNVRRHMSGKYQCEVSNKHGSATSNSIMLAIRYAPYCKFSSTLAYGLSLFEATNLVCQVDSNPMPTLFRWKFERESDLTLFNFKNYSSMLLYQPNSTQHYGTIECTAQNEVGMQQNPCKYHIIDSGPPNFPFYCQLHNQSVVQITVKCTSQKYASNDINGLTEEKHNADSIFAQTIFVHPTTFYIAEVYDKYGNLIQNISTFPLMPFTNSSFPNDDSNQIISNLSSSSFSFHIGHLSESSIYKIKIYALNSKGKSDELWISGQTLRKAEKYTYSNTTESSLLFSNYSLNHIKIIMLSLCGFLVLILIIIVIAITYMSRFCQRFKKKNTSQLTECASNEETADDESSLHSNYALENLGIQTVYTETNDAICADYYNNLLSQYSPKGSNNLELLSLNLYNVNKGPPDLIPTFYYNNENTSDIAMINS